MGMTDTQYKGMLLDEKEKWEETLILAKKDNNKDIIALAEKQIRKIDEKLKL
ncbi:MAG: hypothetical protein IJ682_01185 [Lachnospiraceae bacterium]|nr:hypothetical protein [Lachnospiraceae bacterium]